jgi:hypothetical protein
VGAPLVLLGMGSLSLWNRHALLLVCERLWRALWGWPVD